MHELGREPEKTHPAELITSQLLYKTDTDYGQTHTELYTTPNGRHYEVVIGEPDNQRSDIAVGYTTPWFTGIGDRHNKHTMQNLLKLGYPAVMIGPEGGHAEWPRTPAAFKRFVQQLGSISLDETATNMHQILDATDGKGLYRPGHIISTGESRGAMAGYGVNAKANNFNRNVVYSDYSSPCFAQSPRLRNVPEHIPSPLAEITTTANLLGKVSLKRFVAIKPGPHYLLHALATIPTLLSGQAGELAKQIPRDNKIHNALLAQDRMGQNEIWKIIFADYPFVVNTVYHGGHMGSVSDDVLRGRRERLGNLRDELTEHHGNIQQINWGAVHMLGQTTPPPNAAA